MWKMNKAKQLLAKRGLTRKELAEYIGIEPQSLNNILCGNHNPSRPVLILMAQALHTTLEELEPEKNSKAG
jgi:transcriptional regulator with XRE-family HTH domain